MATPTYDLLESQTLSAAANSVTFSSITQGYSDLVIVTESNATATGYVALRLNGDTGSNYSQVYMGSGGSGQFTDTYGYLGIITLAGNPHISTLQLLDYATTDREKTVLARSSRLGSRSEEAKVIRWNNSSAITQIELFRTSGNFTPGSTFNLYGIAG